ncbi:hypothetical protein [Longicatena caecimuris]|nr:hypothetical protein [Longicatena caecimuris]MCR1870474.1 hypothetical protein [Longicatena caecimuris]MCU0103129.1 hypothetical protein [Longicatena caecimuris]
MDRIGIIIRQLPVYEREDKMIKLHFFDYGNYDLDIEKELGIQNDVIDFVTDNIQNISFDSTDNEFDLEDNWIFWFKSDSENETLDELNQLISSRIRNESTMKYQITIDEM